MEITKVSKRGARGRIADSTIRRMALVFAMTVAFVMPAAAASADMSVGQDNIVGGTAATSVADFPHIVSIGGCGGSLIAPTWVMTAAHCFFDDAGAQTVPNSGAGLAATLNTLSLDPLDAGAEVRSADRLIIHPDYNPATAENDIAVFRITEASTMTPTKLGAASNAALWAPGLIATAKGWGTTSFGGNVSNILRQVQLPIVSDADCNASDGGPIVGAVMICAGNLASGGVDTCQGDSGGPLSVPDPTGGWVTFGVVSVGVGCANANSPGIYAEVAAYEAWLAQNVPELDDNPNPNPTPSTGFAAVGPDRAGDTRDDGARVAAGNAVAFTVGEQYAGQSIAVNLTVTGALARGFATLYRCDENRPGTSSLNYQAGQAIANGVITQVSAKGTVCVYVSQSAHVVLDVFGSFPAGAGFTSVTPDRVGDTRADGGGIPTAGSVAAFSVGSQYAGRSIAVNLTVAGSSARGFATMFACDQDRPDTSSLNYRAGQAIANGVITEVSATGTVCVYVNRSAHIIIDVFGSFATAAAFTPRGPTRAADTRTDGFPIPEADSAFSIDVGSEFAGKSIAVNLTVAGALDRGFITLYACDQNRPATSSLNYQAGQAIANGVITQVSLEGDVCVYVSQSAHVVLDVFGGFPASTRPPLPPRLDPALDAPFGTISIDPGFLPDPALRSVTSGGEVDVSYLGGDCVGFAAKAPDLKMRYSGGGAYLRVSFDTAGTGDTVLVINDANGDWLCNDDVETFGDFVEGNGFNPAIEFSNPQAGLYDIWVGSFVDGEFIEGTLSITERP